MGHIFRDAKKKVINAAATVISAPKVGYYKAKSIKHTLDYGNTLYKEGYGKYYDSAFTVAKKGKKNPDRH